MTKYYGARTIALAGEVWATSAATLWTKVDALKAETDVGSSLVFKFTRDGRAYQEFIGARVASPVVMRVASGAALVIPWSVTLVAPDPRFYSNTHYNTPVAVAVPDTAENDGNVPIDPWVNISGPINSGGTL